MKRMKLRGFDLDIKAVNEDGFFNGYGSVFGVVDSYREIVAPGAFTNSLKNLKKSGRKLPILWQHKTGEPIGTWLELEEDDHGLHSDGSLWLDEAPYAKIAYRGMKDTSISGLSIGYYVIKDSYNEKDRIRTLQEVDLVEISIVTMPANDEARIESVKARIAHGELPDLPTFEKILREAGFSKSQAAVIANRGFSHLLRSESASTDEIMKIVKQASEFRLPQF